MKIKSTGLLASGLALVLLAGCVGKPDYTLNTARYPEATSYSAAYDRVAQIEDGSLSVSDQEVNDAYDALLDAEGTYREQLQSIRDGAEEHLPNLVDFSAETSQALFRGRAENTVYSPVSLYLALSMLAEATGGDTQQQITALLGPEHGAAAGNALWRMTYQNGRGQTSAANSLWVSDQYDVQPLFAQRLSEVYYADSFSVPMGTKTADDLMQSWLRERTGGLLDREISGLTTKPETALSLLSTLYFHNMWSQQFSPAMTDSDLFTLVDGTILSTPFMHDQSTGTWHQGDGFISADRYFQEGGKMRFVLPDAGILPQELLTDPEVVTDMLTGEQEMQSLISWSVPKFDISSDLELSNQLKALGVTDAFSAETADFSPALGAAQASLSQVQQAGRVQIDENGCTAAAYTALMLDGSALPPDNILHFQLNRPFLFIIMTDDDIPLFIGTVYEP